MNIGQWAYNLRIEAWSLSVAAAIANAEDGNNKRALELIEDSRRKYRQCGILVKRYYPKHWKARVTV